MISLDFMTHFLRTAPHAKFMNQFAIGYSYHIRAPTVT